ncbi:MAG: EAL domain-containing protein [Rhodocyclaceae bacterium]|nr:MAG: EAL domain-containing protein [Rhodocyclaceae bacterium]
MLSLRHETFRWRRRLPMDRLILFPALRIALIYLLLSVVWIAVSDKVVATLFTDPAALTHAQTWKGWAFVTVTAVLLGFLVQHEMERYSRIQKALDHARAEQLASEQRYHRMFAESPLPAWVSDSETDRILAVNEAAIKHYGYSREEWLHLTTHDLRPPTLAPKPEEDQLKPVRQIRGSGVWSHMRKDGSVMDMEIATHDLDFEGRPARMVIANDITERRQAEERIYYLAYFDALTGLPNRVLLMERLRSEVQAARQQRHSVVLAFVDLDRFKDINDSLGHKAGDELLQETARRLTRMMPRGGTVARMSADLFALLLSGHIRREDSQRLANDALACLGGPIDLGSLCMVEATACIGLALFPDDGDDDSTMMRNAEAALHHAISQGRNQSAFYQADMNTRSLERLAMETDLRQSLEQGRFVLHYQPQIALSGRVTGVEALVRWNHPTQGLVSPARFIPLAEESGLIIPLGTWVLQEACRQASLWHRDGLELTMAVNLSSIQFRQPRLVAHVAAVLEQTGLPPALLELEVTESIIMGDTDDVADTLRSLQDMGVQISIDDFGTGYSSLAYLGRLAVNKLKIDQSFVRGIPAQSDAAAITATIIALAKNLHLTVIAEGVETSAQADFLRKQDCDEMQGYLFSRPLPPREAEDFIRSRNTLPG